MAMGRGWIVCAAVALLIGGARAETAPVAASGAPTSTQVDSTLKKPPTEADLCPSTFPPETPQAAETPHGTMQVQPGTRWQPVGGEVQFALTGMEKPPDNVTVYFAWEDQRGKTGFCHQSRRVRLMPRTATTADTTYLYAALVPSLDSNGVWVVGSDHEKPTSTVPIVDVYVHGVIPVDAGKPVAFVLTDTLGISSPWVVYALVVAGSVLVFGLLAWWAKKRDIPGGWLLRIISSPNGVASLSQFQIFIWTAVIGVGVVYVMMLSGNLIFRWQRLVCWGSAGSR